MIRHLVATIDALGDRIHPIVVLMLRKQGFWKGWVPVYLWAAWKLFHFNLSRQRPFFVKYGVSLLVYLSLTVCFVGLWFALHFLLVGV